MIRISIQFFRDMKEQCLALHVVTMGAGQSFLGKFSCFFFSSFRFVIFYPTQIESLLHLQNQITLGFGLAAKSILGSMEANYLVDSSRYQNNF